jgi:porin
MLFHAPFRSTLRPRRAALAALIATAVYPTGGTLAAPPPVSIPVDPDSFQGPVSSGPFGFLNNLTRSNYLLGDMWGLRSWLSGYGISFALVETSEILGNASGGARKGFEYDGLTQAVLQLDTNRAFGHYGGLFNVSALQLHGRNVSADNLSSLQTSSGIEADRATRLWELWYQQKFLDEDRLDIRIGQQSLDQEFMVSQNAGYLINTMFGWPMLPSADMLGGGPAYPLSAPGVRARYRPVDSLYILAGVYSGSPVSNGSGDPQKANTSGTDFPMNKGALMIAELQYVAPSLGNVVYPGESPTLSRTYKIGMWYDTQPFADLQYDQSGRSLADPASSGNAQMHRGNFALYAVADQMVWVNPADANRNISVFARVMGTPLDDRNQIKASINAGLVMRQPWQYRNGDTFAIGMGHARLSDRVAAANVDSASLGGSYTPIRHSETFVETTYQYAVAPWMQLQPDIQYIFNPGGGVTDSRGERIGDELVLGVRTNILF